MVKTSGISLFLLGLWTKCRLCLTSYTFIEFSSIAVSRQHPDLAVSSFYTVTKVSLSTCTDLCNNTRACSYMTYHRRARVCFLIDAEDHTVMELRNAEGFVSYNKTKWSPALSSLCDNCTDYETCDLQTSLATKCILTGCGRPDTKSNAFTLGNVNIAGSKVLYRCYNNIDLSNTSVCESSGQWSATTLNCPEEITSTTTTTTPTTPLACPVYSVTTLSDKTTFQYLPFITSSSRKDARSYCSKNCGRLVEVTTAEKFNYLKTFLKNTYGEQAGDWWIDGTYSKKKKDWKTQSGDTLPEDSSLWSDTSWKDKQCVRLDAEENYIFNDIDCKNTYNVLCEKI